MFPDSLPLIVNGSLRGRGKMFNGRRCSMYTGVQFGRVHCKWHKHSVTGWPTLYCLLIKGKGSVCIPYP